MVLVTALPAQGQERCLSYLAICQKTWPCENSLSVFKDLPRVCAGYLANTFGSDCKCGDRLLALKKPKTVRVHLVNETCLPGRGRVCGSYEVLAGETQQSFRTKIASGNKRLIDKIRVVAARESARIRNARKPLDCYVSPLLETKADKETRRRVHDIVRPYFPECKLVDNPVGDSCIKGALCESHGSNARGDIVDLDGEDFQKVDMPAYMSRNRLTPQTHIWGGKFNCIDPHISGFVDPRSRVCTANQNYFNAAAQYLTDEGSTLPDPKPFNPKDLIGCSKVLEPPDGSGGFTWKQSDAHPGVVAILPHEFEPRSVWAMRRGKRVAEFTSAGSFKGDGRPMYRTSKPAKDFPPSTVLHGDSTCWKLKFPMFRID